MLSDENRTLVAEGNVAKINQRFKELEAELRAVREDVKILTNAVGTAQNLIHAQAQTIANIYANVLQSY